MVKESKLADWERFWERKQELSAVYPSVSNVAQEILREGAVDRKKVLEVGAGTGRDSVQLARAGATVVVLDYADNALGLLKKALDGQLRRFYLVKADAFRLPFKDNSLDIVFHQGLLEHFRNPQDLLAENRRVLASGGLLVVDVPQKFHPYTLIKHALILVGAWFAGWETEFTAGQLKRLVTAQGLTVRRLYGSWMYPSLWYRMLREALLRLKLARMPLVPRPWPLAGRARRAFRQWFRERALALYTVNAIGIIGEKP
jgi:ubiquinone/menaquinone biosynthesis C-methylase UbiE